MLTVVNIIGTGLGFVIPSFFVPEDEVVVPETVRGEFLSLQIFYFIFSGIIALLNLFFFKESPPTLPRYF